MLAATLPVRSRRIMQSGALLIALAAGVVAGCPLDLERGLSCGDGWWDPEYEECDPMDPERSYAGACRALGFEKDAECDPQTCRILASEADCNVCGDGIAFGTEECDGDDLRGHTCQADAGTLRCTSECTLDYSDCPPFCGDDIVNGDEECEPAILCTDNEDCSNGDVCHMGNCIEVGQGFAPNLACSNYETKALGINKPYASGTIGACVVSGCFFGRNDCSFCGDGELDLEYTDLVAPSGTGMFPAEVCDGDMAVADKLASYCEPLCVEDALHANAQVFCDFECKQDCSGFALPGNVVPGQDPESIGCCLAPESPCPFKGTEDVPEFPCCSWLEKPEWLAEQKCVPSGFPVSYVCP